MGAHYEEHNGIRTVWRVEARLGRCTTVLLAATTVLFLLLTLRPATASSAAQGPWVLPATDLSAPGGNALAPQVAFGPNGTAAAVWYRSEGGNYVAQVATRPPGGVFGAPVDLSSPATNVSYPQVAITPDGTVVVAWSGAVGGSHFVQAAVRPPGGVFGTSVDISAPSTEAMPPDLAAGPDGATIAVWPRFDGSDWIAQAATRPANGSFGPAEDLSAAGGIASGTQVAIEPDGTATAVWQLWADSKSWIQAAIRPPGGGFGAAVDLTPPAEGHQANFPQVAAGAGGTTAVWLHDFGVSSVVEAATRPPGGAFGSPVELSAQGRHAGRPQVAVDPSGAAVAVWFWPEDDGHNTIQAAIRPPGGAFGSPVRLSAPGESADRPQVSMAPDGTATAIWYRWSGSEQVVQASTRPPNGVFGGPVDLSAPGQDAVDPQVAIGPDGSAIAVWRRGSVGNLTIQSASTVRPSPPPAAGPSPPPAAGSATCANAYLKLGRFRAIRRKGFGILKVRVGAPGRVILRGSKQVRRSAKKLRRRGVARLRVRAKGRALRKLRRRGRVKVRVRVIFRPAVAGCKPTSKTRKVRLVK